MTPEADIKQKHTDEKFTYKTLKPFKTKSNRFLKSTLKATPMTTTPVITAGFLYSDEYVCIT